jgi:hypothetical protein
VVLRCGLLPGPGPPVEVLLSATLLLGVGVVYLGVAVGYWREGRLGMAFAFVAYAAANLGFAMDLWRQS